MTTVRIGTRGSALALWQADHVAAMLRAALPGLSTTRIIYKTMGDHILDRPLAEIGGKGLFTKELEEGLLADAIDIAVHSMKDMPTGLPDGLCIGAVPERADVRDCVLRRPGEADVEPQIVGTASLRRACLARARWPNARIEPIRGNVATRVGRLHEAPPRRCDVILLAFAGLQRLGIDTERDLLFEPADPSVFIPAVGQGAIAVECRGDDAGLQEILATIHDPAVARCVTAERAFLRGVEGDCKVPVGALARVVDGALALNAFIGHPETGQTVSRTVTGVDPEALGEEAAATILRHGGAAILALLR